VRTLPTPCARDGKGPGHQYGLPDLVEPRASDTRGPDGHGDGGADLRTTIAGLGALDQDRWGAYAPAIAQWELLLGRPVPEPAQPGIHGRPVLAPPFVEWLMGLPPGWVTGLGLPRTAALRVLGNGVVVQQAAVALRLLLCPHRWAVAP
jgi:hypothetical protein